MLTNTRYAVQPWPSLMLPVSGLDEFFPVRRIWCVGRNYADHAREMGGDPNREAPFFFAKAPDSLLALVGSPMPTLNFPRRTENLQHEVELVVAIGADCSAVPAAKAREHIYGYAIGLDMTRRDLQLELRDKGRPWDMGKTFDQAAPVGMVHPAVLIGHPDHGAIWLEVNGEPRQKGDLSAMIWSVPEVVSQLSNYVDLRAGDLIFTGTPEGVGRVRPGDEIRAGIAGLGEIKLRIGD